MDFVLRCLLWLLMLPGLLITAFVVLAAAYGLCALACHLARTARAE
jgi:hypothetical protein